MVLTIKLTYAFLGVQEYFELKKDSKTWEAIVKHAKECDLEGNRKLKSYIVEEQNVVLFFNCVYDLVGAKFHGFYITKDNFNSAQQVKVEHSILQKRTCFF